MSVLFLLVWGMFTPSYDTNDDVALSMIASGTGIAAAPDAHLIFTNVAIGAVLKELYGFAHNVPWYGLYLFAVQFLAQTAILYSVLAWRYVRGAGLLFFLCFATIGVHLLVNPQYTSTAFLAVEAGVVLSAHRAVPAG